MPIPTHALRRGLSVVCLSTLALALAVPGLVEAGSPDAGLPPLRRWPKTRTILITCVNKVATETPEIRIAKGVTAEVIFTASVLDESLSFTGAEGRIAWSVPPPAGALLIAGLTDQPGPPISLTVATNDRRKYSLRITTHPDGGDERVWIYCRDQYRQSGDAPLPAPPPPRDPFVEILLGDEPVALRNSGQPSLARPPLRAVGPKTASTLQIQAVARWGSQLYVRVWRKRSDRSVPWKVQVARLEDASGNWLRVLGVYWRESGWNDINVIVAEAPAGAAEGDTLKIVELVSQDMQRTGLDQPVVLP